MCYVKKLLIFMNVNHIFMKINKNIGIVLHQAHPTCDPRWLGMQPNTNA